MEKFARSEDLKRWRGLISKFAPPLRTAPPNAGQTKPNPAPPNPNAGQLPRPANAVPVLPATAKGTAVAPSKKAMPPKAASNEIKMKCTACSTPMRIPRKVLEGKAQVNVRCPNAACGKVITLKQKPASAPVRKDEEGSATD
jgi:hypothetical protein